MYEYGDRAPSAGAGGRLANDRIVTRILLLPAGNAPAVRVRPCASARAYSACACAPLALPTWAVPPFCCRERCHRCPCFSGCWAAVA